MRLRAGMNQRRQRRGAVGHVAGIVELQPRQVQLRRSGRDQQIRQGQVFQCPLAGRQGVRAVLARRLVGVVLRQQFGLQGCRDGRAHELARRVDRLRIDLRHALGDDGFRRQDQGQLAEGRIERVVGQQGALRGDEGLVQHQGLAGGDGDGQFQQAFHGQALARFPAVDGIAVVTEQVQQLRIGIVVLQHHGRGKVAQQRRHWRFCHVIEAESLRRLRQFQHDAGGAMRCHAVHVQRQVAAIGRQQADGDGNVEWQFFRLARRGRAALRQRQFKRLAGSVIARGCSHDGGAGLAVPALELLEIAAIRVRHGGAEVVALHRLAIVTLEVQVHALAETVAAHQGLIHAHHFGAFFVDGDRIKVIDLDEGIGTHRMRHRARVFGELRLAQGAHLVDARDGAARVGADHVGREFLVAKYRQAFLQRQLEPVAAGHAVARPVMEVLVAHHRLDARVIDVGRHARIGQHILGIEDVQTLVFHGAHVEIAHGDDHEAVQVQLQAEALLVPADRVFQRLHGVVGFIEVALFHPYLQQHFAARLQGVALFLAHQARRHQGEQIGWLLERVFPLGVMAAVTEVALFDQVAVR